jgi:uncharacterized OB-fold protein
MCPHCCSIAHDWIRASGRGTVYTFTIVRQALARGWDELLPYVVAVIELDEGPKLLSNLINVAPEDVHIGMDVEVVFVEADAEQKLPLFKPRS